MSKWEKVKLADICNLNMGQSPESSSYNQDGDGIPFYQGNADFGELNPETRYFCNSPTKIAKKYDILLSVRAPIGAINIATETCCIGRGLAALTAQKNITDMKFLYYVLKRKNAELNQKGTGSTFKAINKQNLSEVLCPLPPLETQKQIAKTLDTAAELLAMRKQQLAELDNLIKSTFYDMFGDPLTNEKGWDINEINNVCSDIVDCPHSTPIHSGVPTNYPSIRTSELQNGNINWSSMKYISETEYLKRISRIKPQENDIIYGREGSYGDAVILPSGYSFCLGQRVMLVRANIEICHYKFLWYVVRSDYVYNQAKQKNVGATVGHVNVGDIKKFIIPLPPLLLQNQFAEIVTKIEEQKALVQKAIDESQYLFDSLTSEFFE